MRDMNIDIHKNQGMLFNPKNMIIFKKEIETKFDVIYPSQCLDKINNYFLFDNAYNNFLIHTFHVEYCLANFIIFYVTLTLCIVSLLYLTKCHESVEFTFSHFIYVNGHINI